MPRTLFISGSGFNIFNQGGVLKYLGQLGADFDLYAGTSSGSFLCCALTFGFTIDELYLWGLETITESQKDLRESIFNVLYGSLISDKGKATFIRRMIEASPLYKEKLSGIPVEKITFSQLGQVTPKKFLCNATLLTPTGAKLRIFSEWTTPDVPVHWAVMASMSLLGIFRPATDPDSNKYIDGGFMTDYLPICFSPENRLYYKNIPDYKDVTIPIDLDTSWGILYSSTTSFDPAGSWNLASLIRIIPFVVQLFVRNQILDGIHQKILDRTWTVVSPSLDSFPDTSKISQLYNEGHSQAVTQGSRDLV